MGYPGLRAGEFIDRVLNLLQGLDPEAREHAMLYGPWGMLAWCSTELRKRRDAADAADHMWQKLMQPAKPEIRREGVAKDAVSSARVACRPQAAAKELPWSRGASAAWARPLAAYWAFDEMSARGRKAVRAQPRKPGGRRLSVQDVWQRLGDGRFMAERGVGPVACREVREWIVQNFPVETGAAS